MAANASRLLEMTDAGLYCPAGGFHIDPSRPVLRAVVTHAHTDHLRPGSAAYLVAREGHDVTRVRLGGAATIESLAYGASTTIDGVRVSFHPAGHILGSAQVRVEHGGYVAVAAGDYKTEPDPTAAAFEPVPCDLFITESTFALPIYRWRPQDEVFAQINAWWRNNRDQGRTSVLYAYSLGKAQRLLSGLDPTIGPILVSEVIEAFLPAYRAQGIALPPMSILTPEAAAAMRGRAMIVAPQTSLRTGWMAASGDVSAGFASGWMQVAIRRRSTGIDAGFVLSDHADWPGLLSAIEATGASTVWTTHGFAPELARYLTERGTQAMPLR